MTQHVPARKLTAMVAIFPRGRGSLHLRKARRRNSNLPRPQLMLPRQAEKFWETQRMCKRGKTHSNANSFWLRASSLALKALEAPGCIRIWHNGSLTQGLEGRAPEHVKASNFQVSRVQGSSDQHNTAAGYPDTWVITYVLTWTGGKLRESSTWVAGENGPRILMHQSSPISAR